MTAYLTIGDVVSTHTRTMEISGDGDVAILDLGALESAIGHMQNDDYYPTFEDKLTHLLYTACKGHCFLNGNKRMAIAVSAQFLLLNGYLHCVATFLRIMENVSYYVADNKIDKALLREIVEAIINEDEQNEQLIIKIGTAIQAL